MNEREASALVGLKREIKAVRANVRELKDEAARWCKVCSTLRGLAGLDDGQYRNLLKAESLPCD
ncbi:hypothetical protein [Bradyrhizobium diazoefficiens]|uniref:hypothetical protein n=1 Tax=Bradyrhizobium diazoefficiens TaxID=1355477 RepID=UPI00347707E3